MNDDVLKEKRFGYSAEFLQRRYTHFTLQVAFIALLLFFTVLMPFISKYPVGGAQLVFVILTFLFSFALYAEHSLNSDIVVDDYGLRRYWRGICWKTVRWKDITSVCLYSYPVLDNFQQIISLSVTYELRISDRWKPAFSRNGPIVFAGTMPNVDDLCRIINEHVQGRHIPVLDKRDEHRKNPVALNSVPLPPRTDDDSRNL